MRVNGDARAAINKKRLFWGLMSSPAETAFLRELDKKLWTAADKLRSNLDAAVYKHAVLGLVFLQYVSDSFELRQQEVEQLLKNPKGDFYTDPKDHKSKDKYEEAIRAELEVRDYYTQQNVFWVPALARWKTIQDSAEVRARAEVEGLLHTKADMGNYPYADKYRWGTHLWLDLNTLRSHSTGFFLHTYYGRDYLNIRYDRVVWLFMGGLSFTIAKYVPFGWRAAETIED